MIKLLLYILLFTLLYRMVFLPAKEGYQGDKKRPRILKKKDPGSDGDYVDYEEVE